MYLDETHKTFISPKRIGLVFLAFLILGGFFFFDNRKVVMEAVTDIKNNWRLAPYEKKVQACLVQAREQTSGQKVVGLEFSCAIKIGKEIYAQDQDLAMELCLRHSLIKKPEFESAARRTCLQSMSDEAERQEPGDATATTTPRKITPTTTIEVIRGALVPLEQENVILR